MISKETLEAVRIGVLTDKELSEAIPHFTVLEEHLRCHGDKYHLVWKDVFYELHTLREMRTLRMQDKRML